VDTRVPRQVFNNLKKMKKMTMNNYYARPFFISFFSILKNKQHLVQLNAFVSTDI
jgi:hypothetical protein